jgi:hypothetical protein
MMQAPIIKGTITLEVHSIPNLDLVKKPNAKRPTATTIANKYISSIPLM